MTRILALAALLLAGGCTSETPGSTTDATPQGASVQRAVADTEAAQREAATMRAIGPTPATGQQQAGSDQTRRAAPGNNTVPSDAPGQGTN